MRQGSCGEGKGKLSALRIIYLHIGSMVPGDKEYGRTVLACPNIDLKRTPGQVFGFKLRLF
jgi:hypothetical protein